MKLKLQNVRIAFPKLFVATKFKAEDRASFSASFLMAPDDPQVDTINDMIDALAIEKWGAKGKAILAELRGKDKLCLHNGDTKATVEGYAGNWYLSTRAYVKPLVIGQKREILTEESGKPYGGCYVNATVDLYAQDNNFGKRINAVLTGVQFYRDGDAFAGGVPADPNEFDDIDDTGDDIA